MTHANLIEAAFVNYLMNLNPNPWPESLTAIFPGENNLDKAGQRIVAYIDGGDLGEEEPPLSGNRMTEVTVQIRTPFSKLTAEEAGAGRVDPLTQHQKVTEALQIAILNMTPEGLTAAVDGFSVWGIANRTEVQTQEDNAWADEWKVKILSCPASFEN